VSNHPFKLFEHHLNFYRQNGFIKLKDVLTPDEIAHMNSVITREVERFRTEYRPLAERDTYGKAFLQVMNLWTRSEQVRDIVFSKRLAGIASGLMGTKGVRIYHDQALYKEPGGGHTPWHADQYYWPLASEKTVTAWIPLQETPMELGPLEFSAGSFNLKTGRDKAISDESQQLLEEELKKQGFRQVAESFSVGEVSFHTGWLFHRAGSNKTDRMRKAMTIIYMDSAMRLKSPENKNQQLDWETWCPGAIPGEIIDTPLNPVIG
jgi:ectoine hydroxylase-related dioxygenase (phytanoyl-CoA dioxygenase family)